MDEAHQTFAAAVLHLLPNSFGVSGVWCLDG